MHVYIPLWAFPAIAILYLAVGLLAIVTLVGGGLVPWPEPGYRRWYHWPILVWLTLWWWAVVLVVFVLGVIGLVAGAGDEPECEDCDG